MIRFCSDSIHVHDVHVQLCRGSRFYGNGVILGGEVGDAQGKVSWQEALAPHWVECEIRQQANWLDGARMRFKHAPTRMLKAA